MPLLLEECIPIEKKKLIVILRDSLSPEERPLFEHFARLLEECCHRQLQTMLGEIYDSYEPFHPNTNSLKQSEQIEDPLYARNLIDKLKKFLEEAQYQKISEHDIRDILYFERSKLKIIFPVEKYQEFLVYFCGEDVAVQYQRSWATLWLTKRAKKIPYYKKLVVLFRPFKVFLKKNELKATEHKLVWDMRDPTLPQPILLKLFQNIPYNYLPIIFPDALFKIPVFKKLYWMLLNLATSGLIVCGLAVKWWYGLGASLPLSLFLYSMLHYISQKERYYHKLLAHFYTNDLSNNQGIFRHLVDQAEEETYKQLLVVFHAFWRKETWTFGAISANLLNTYLQKFLLECCGVQVKLNLENLLVEAGNVMHKERHWLPQLLTMQVAARTCLQTSVALASDHLDAELTSVPLARSGIVEIASGTEKSERQVFGRDAFLLHIEDQQGLKHSHPAGAVIRWVLEHPYTTELASDCPPQSNCLAILPRDTQDMPLQGLGKIVAGEESFEFRYYRHVNSNELFLTAGLRYRHVHTPQSPVLVRPLLPSFTLASPVAEGSSEIPLGKSSFPPAGLVKFYHPKHGEFLCGYTMKQNDKNIFLQLEGKTPVSYETGTRVSLTPPVTVLESVTAKGSLLLHVKSSKHFSRRGTLILSPDTEQEERLPFYREALVLELNAPLGNYHRDGSFVQLERTSKSKLIRKALAGEKTIFVHGFGEDISAGTLTISHGQSHQEMRQFRVVHSYIYLGSPTRFHHPVACQVWEAKLESPLRYEAFQGSHLITVENAEPFPLQGTLEIHFNGTSGVKEVFTFARTQCSNTLLLTAPTGRHWPASSQVLVGAVETAADAALHYHAHTLRADFSRVPSFPEKGAIIIEPGSHAEEVLSFTRYPRRLYLKNKLRHEHAKGSLLTFAGYDQYMLTEALAKSVDRLSLEFGHLLPERGCLVLQNDEQSDIVWYRKVPYRVLLEQPCRFHHSRGGWVRFPGISDNVSIAAAVDKGSQEIKVINGQELPKKGRIYIRSMLHIFGTEFVREGETLYLRDQVPYHFSSHAGLDFPTVHLHNHLAPGMDYVEVSDPSLLPECGELVLEKAPRGMYGKKRVEERIAFRYSPDILWLDTPLPRRYELGTFVFSPDLQVKGAGALQVRPLRDAVKELSNLLMVNYK
jgi:hypothetical protein